MQHGHVTGRKHESPDASAWYAAIEAETLRQLEAEAATQQALAPEEAAPHA